MASSVEMPRTDQSMSIVAETEQIPNPRNSLLKVKSANF